MNPKCEKICIVQGSLVSYLRLIVIVLALFMSSSAAFGIQGCGCSNNVGEKTLGIPSSCEVQTIYDHLLAATSFGQDLLYEDNLTGRIVWNEAQFMESLVNMYEATHNRRYLEIFLEHAEHVLQVRDDHAGRLDYAGRLRPGWQTGGYYTLGIPVVIPDDRGSPAIEVQGVHTAGNDSTVVEIIEEDDRHFMLVVRNNFRRKEPVVVSYGGLTLETAEETVNADLSPSSWVRIRVVGNALPHPGIYPLGETYRMVIHELHTPIIGIPFLKFADLVFRSPELTAYQSRAEKYVHAFEQSFQDYSNLWREDMEEGYFVFEPGGKFWASGLTVPYNGLSANGRFLLWLWRVTGNTNYLEKATALARKIRAGITFLPDGTLTIPYWVKDSLPYVGWKDSTTDPANSLYIQCNPDRATEDISHFSLTLRFMVEAWQMGVVFEEADLNAITRTFVKRIWKPSGAKIDELCDPDPAKGFFLAHNLDGKSIAYDYAIGTFALLSRWEPSMLARALEVYGARYKNVDCLDIDYLYGEIMLGWSILAMNGEATTITFRDKPLYPFTLRASAEEYVKSSKLVSLDQKGIPVTDYGDLHGGAGRRYNPTFIANYTLALYRDYLVTKDSTLLQAFQKQVQWFLEHRVCRKYHGFEFWVWEFDFDHPLFKAKAPWVSALSQGRVLCVFLAAYDLLKDPEYIRAAEYIFRSFVVPTSAGGVATFEEDAAWYEEVADEEAPSSKILNGHVAALQGLWTFWKWTGRIDAKRYLDLGIAAVRKDISLYDAGFLSYYSQYPTDPREYGPVRDYNTLHVHQLLWLYEVTTEPIFLKYAFQFARYDTPGWQITTAGSTDPVGHGPDNLFFQMYSRYWSHNQFPTWVQLDLVEPQFIEGIVLFGYTPQATARDFQVFVSEDGKKWTFVLEKLGNEEQHFVQQFNPLLARFVKIVILKDNGNNNVALTGVAVIRQYAIPMVVSDWESFSSGNIPVLALDRGWKVPEKGWVIIDLGSRTPQDITIELTGSVNSGAFTLYGTDNLDTFDIIVTQEAQIIEGRFRVVLHHFAQRYLKIVFRQGCGGGNLRISLGHS